MLVLAASFIYAKVINKADDEFDTSDVKDRLTTATGDLTLHGVAKSVTFLVEATFQSGQVGVLGQIPIVFADYDIPNPSNARISTEDNGLLEFVLIFDRA